MWTKSKYELYYSSIFHVLFIGHMLSHINVNHIKLIFNVIYDYSYMYRAI